MIRRIVIILLLVAAIAVSWALGRASGVRHAIVDSAIWTVECYDPDAPDTGAEYDQAIFIELDGQVHEHGMYVG